jgi:hypothetical protein
VRIGIANAAEVDALWPMIAGQIQKACSNTGGDISSGDLWQMCRSGNAFLIVVMDDDDRPIATITLQFQKWSEESVLRCLSIAGENMSEWLPDAMEFVSKMARENGASCLVADGRDGWARVFPGAKRLRVTYKIEV